MRNLILFACLLPVLIGCNPNEEEYSVRYKVVRTSQEPVTYRAIFTVPGTGTRQVGPIEEYWWESDALPNFDEGSTARVSIEILEGEGTFEVTIFRNGGEWGVGDFTLDMGESESVETQI